MLAAPALAGGLALSAVALAGPVSAALARAAWGDRIPRATLILFQAVCLAAGLLLIESALVLAVQQHGNDLLSGLAGWLRLVVAGTPLAGMSGIAVVAGTVAVVLVVVLAGALVRSLVLAGRRRHGHRLLLDLLTGGQDHERSADDVLAGVRILDHPSAVAYTLPGWHSRVVVTAGLVELLDADGVAAVVAHERAHVRSRHDLLILPFQTWTAVAGWLPGVRAAADRVAELAEMLADDGASRRTSRTTVAAALVAVATAGVPRDGALGGITPAVAERAVAGRVARLTGPEKAGPSVPVVLAAAVLLLLPIAALFVPWS